ncbi:MAG TPA: cbb3-type cytochrome c oxidase subunit I [Casimicrobiaceae bacterium]|nr:cbb3-type cytochrome c oxidase subunit I [Casimicrobiaceae bacterium]
MKADATAPAPDTTVSRVALDVAFGRYALAVPRDGRSRLATGWLALGVAALAASGLLAVFLALARTPGVNRFLPAGDFFRTVLVAHVDLSVLVWFVSFAGAVWSLNSTPRALPLGRVALALAILGSAAIAVAPFVDPAAPIMANYIPVIDGPVFKAGLALFAAGATLLVARGLFASPLVGARLDGAGTLRFGANAAIVAGAVALLAFAWSLLAVPRDLEARAYYELAFWGGGHVLQFAWTLLLLVAWLLLADASGVRVPISPRVVALLFGIQLVAVFATTLVYLAWDVTSVEHHRLQTWLMRLGGALAIPVVAAAVIAGLARRWRDGPVPADARPLVAALVVSLILFGAGGAIGFAIEGSNVKIPAHYHGAIVGVTIALMGLAYWLLPRLGAAPPRPRLAVWQATLYGAGQLMHIAGLLWSGGYGVQRKVAGGEQVLRSTGEVVGMGLMGAGGLVAVVGGVLFVVVVALAVRDRPRA